MTRPLSTSRPPRRALGSSLLALLWLVLVLTAVPAWSQGASPTADDKAKAAALYDEAVKLYQEGKLEESAQTLEQAYQHDPNPVLAYNIGKAYDDAADLNKAETWYRTALEAEDLNDEERRKATKAIERIEKVKAQLSNSEADKEAAEADKEAAEADKAAAEAERQRMEEEKARVERELAEATAGRERHEGFFARLAAGPEVGGISATFEGGGGTSDQLSVGGGGFSFAFAVGWTFWDSVAFHIGTFNATYNDPDVEFGGEPVSFLDVPLKSSGVVNINGGPVFGATYFFMPLNLYVSSSIGLVTVQSDLTLTGEYGTGKETGELLSGAGKGWGFEAMVGKEWWIGEEWGLGLVGLLHFAKLSSGGEVTIVRQPTVVQPNPTPRVIGSFTSKFTDFSFGLMASVTFN